MWILEIERVGHVPGAFKSHGRLHVPFWFGGAAPGANTTPHCGRSE